MAKFKKGDVVIVSGEGTFGTAERYTGKKTDRAIKLRLTKERAHGDRWARAIEYSHENEWGMVGIDLETGG
jgi:hypothetical protein